ncbi:hypothetical protein D3C86_1192050 [compost metagenome]
MVTEVGASAILQVAVLDGFNIEETTEVIGCLFEVYCQLVTGYEEARSFNTALPELRLETLQTQTVLTNVEQWAVNDVTKDCRIVDDDYVFDFRNMQTARIHLLVTASLNHNGTSITNNICVVGFDWVTKLV